MQTVYFTAIGITNGRRVCAFFIHHALCRILCSLIRRRDCAGSARSDNRTISGAPNGGAVLGEDVSVGVGVGVVVTTATAFGAGIRACVIVVVVTVFGIIVSTVSGSCTGKKLSPH